MSDDEKIRENSTRPRGANAKGLEKLRPRSSQLDLFAGHDLRRRGRQLDLFGLIAEPAMQERSQHEGTP